MPMIVQKKISIENRMISITIAMQCRLSIWPAAYSVIGGANVVSFHVFFVKSDSRLWQIVRVVGCPVQTWLFSWVRWTCGRMCASICMKITRTRNAKHFVSERRPHNINQTYVASISTHLVRCTGDIAVLLLTDTLFKIDSHMPLRT